MNFDSDPRTICKYGIKCYQKNSQHHKKFKHPVKVNAESTPAAVDIKKRKLDTSLEVSYFFFFHCMH